VVQQSGFGFGEEFDQQIDVAVRAHSSTRRGSEDGEFSDAVSPADLSKLAFVDLN
jgi:hypothetical protein